MGGPRQLFPVADVVKRLMEAMPLTADELMVAIGSTSQSHIKRYLDYMRAEKMVHVCGYADRAHGRLTAMPPRIFGVGPGPDVPFVKKAPKKQDPSEFALRMKKLQEARAQASYERRLRKERNDIFDSVDEESPLRLYAIHKLADKMVTSALAKQNTPFGPLFDLAEKAPHEKAPA